MGRTARIKYLYGTYHIIIRSISEILLFKNSNDKERMLKIIKKYKKISNFKLLGFCLMDTHAHFIIDCNGSDISKFMHGINLSYAMYYNKKYTRHGHVFSDRFKSIPLDDNANILNCSAYVHNNPKDIPGFKDCVEKYPYSSFAIYLGIIYDKYKITDISIIMQMISKNISMARKKYFEFVKSKTHNDVDSDIKLKKYNTDFNNYEYKSEKKYLFENITHNHIINFVAKYTNQNSINIKVKFSHKTSEFRALCCFLMRSFCEFNYKDICSVIGNLSLSGVSRLCNKGYTLIEYKPKYKNILRDFLKEFQDTSMK